MLCPLISSHAQSLPHGATPPSPFAPRAMPRAPQTATHHSPIRAAHLLRPRACDHGALLRRCARHVSLPARAQASRL